MSVKEAKGYSTAEMLRHKFYISGLYALIVSGAVIFGVSAVVAAHDAAYYRTLPESYRLSIEKLQSGWHYEGLPADQQKAILDQHKRWVGDERLPWWEEDRIVDPDAQKAATLAHFEKLVPRWGSRIHQQRPLLAVMISVLAFAPAIAFVCVATWTRWLRSS